MSIFKLLLCVREARCETGAWRGSLCSALVHFLLLTGLPLPAAVHLVRCEITGKQADAMRALCLFFVAILAINGCASRSVEPYDGLDIRGIGSGFAVSSQGHLLTNHHVIADCQAISATTPSGHEIEVRLLRSDPARDLALLMMAEAAPRPALFASPETRLAGARLSGDTVRFLGYPNLGRPSLRPVDRPGRILQFAGGPLTVPVIVFKGKIDPGNSGGPLLTPAGQVIGLVFAKPNLPTIYREAGEEAAKSMTNVGLALPFWEILLFLEQAEISYEIAAGAETGPAAERFMVRVNCWK